MSGLREQILARIKATPFRPPSIADIMRETRLSFITISGELAALINEREIDTQTGDSGLTYILRKPVESGPSPHAPVKLLHIDRPGLAFFPSKNPTAQPLWHERTPAEKETVRACTIPRRESKAEINARAKIEKAAHFAAQRAEKKRAIEQRAHERAEKAKAIAAAKAARASKSREVVGCALIETHLTRPLSVAQFAALAGVKRQTAENILLRAHKKGLINADTSMLPKLFFFGTLTPEIQESARLSACETKRVMSINKAGRDIAQLCAEYERGDLVSVMCKRWKCHAVRLREFVVLGGGRLRIQRNTAASAMRISGSKTLAEEYAKVGLRKLARKYKCHVSIAREALIKAGVNIRVRGFRVSA